MDWTMLATIIASLGGLELVKFLFNRKSQSRLADAEADSAEFKQLREYNEFLQAQLQDKEERFVSQTGRLRATQDELFKERDLRHDIELQLVQKRCDRITQCPFRIPPTTSTPKYKGESVEELFGVENK